MRRLTQFAERLLDRSHGRQAPLCAEDLVMLCTEADDFLEEIQSRVKDIEESSPIGGRFGWVVLDGRGRVLTICGFQRKSRQTPFILWFDDASNAAAAAGAVVSAGEKSGGAEAAAMVAGVRAACVLKSTLEEIE